MPLDEWDKKVAPLLGVISIRADAVLSDIRQIREWVDRLEVQPDFTTVAEVKIDAIAKKLAEALEEILQAKKNYGEKDKVS